MPELTIICVVYKQYFEVRVLAYSLLSQTLQNFKLLLIHDGYDEQMQAVFEEIKSKAPNKIDFAFTTEHHKDWGHSLREIGIPLVETEFLLLTNADNYYAPVFLESMFAGLRQSQADIAICDMIHNHENPGGTPQPRYHYFETGPQPGKIDIGCFIAKAKLAKQVGFRDKTYSGDATYFTDLCNAAAPAKIVKINHALYVHN